MSSHYLNDDVESTQSCPFVACDVLHPTAGTLQARGVLNVRGSVRVHSMCPGRDGRVSFLPNQAAKATIGMGRNSSSSKYVGSGVIRPRPHGLRWCKKQ